MRSGGKDVVSVSAYKGATGDDAELREYVVKGVDVSAGKKYYFLFKDKKHYRM